MITQSLVRLQGNDNELTFKRYIVHVNIPAEVKTIELELQSCKYHSCGFFLFIKYM